MDRETSRLFTELKDKFDSKQNDRKKVIADFDTLVNLFSQDCNTFASIGRQFGVTREAIRVMYNKYFSPVFPRRPHGRARQKFCGLKRFKIFLKKSAGPRVDEIARIAQEKNYSVKKVAVFGNRCVRSVNSRVLVINGHKCKISLITSLFKPLRNESFYAGLKIAPKVYKFYDFLIVIVNVQSYPKRYFILPSTVLQEYGKHRPRSERTFYIPLERRPIYKNHYPKINFWKFENAWHLLKT